jgi:hypothetical protein
MNTQKVIKALLFTPGQKGTWGLPALFEGSPGTAKTSIVEQVCETYQMPLETVIASLREPSDFVGMPVPSDDGLAYMAAPWAKRLATVPRGVAFLDELSTAAQSVQNALLRVVLDRWVGDCHLPHVRFIAAMNKADETANGYELAIALANRFIHLTWEAPSLEQWQDYLMGNGGADEQFDPEDEEKRVLKEWDKAFAISRGMLVGFSQKAPNLIHVQPKSHDPQASKAWPSRRSWELAARAMAGADVHNLDETDKQTLIAGCVGAAHAGEFLAYAENSDMPDPAELLDGKAKWKPDNRLDRTMAVLSSCTALITPANAPKRNDRAAAMWKILGGIVEEQADICEPHARKLSKERLSQMPEAKDVMLALGPVMQAAGLLK